ncbi:MAG: hypothetical protein ACT4NY_08015 [Pseudonocardiales bacterium]
MIIVDTNVVSEIMKPTPAQVVRDWVRVRGSELYTTSITLAQIAAICHTHKAAVATRNLKDFQNTGIDVIDPWQATR